ncbi:MAG: NUDIX hydrolase [Candidatus Moraniibacteriota bacterium]
MTDTVKIDKRMITRLGKKAREAKKQGRKICCHTSVGTIVRNQEGQYLVIRRTKKPFGYACVAGHALDEHTDWLESMRAELLEETGIVVGHESSDLQSLSVLKGVYTNICSRPGCQFHAWKVYELLVDGTPGILTGDGGVKQVLWVTIDRLQELCHRTRDWYAYGKPEEEDSHMEPIWVIHLAKAGLVDIDYSFIDDIDELSYDEF